RSGYRPVRVCAGSRPGAAPPTPACADYLADNAKAATEWRQEVAFAGFERRYGATR
ncbi:adenosine deaminase, partial [Streptomyces sp. SID7982]|nr:adenosine deaminase [Streptomyces sp. SID7982]